jgi:hypothetical protein
MKTQIETILRGVLTAFSTETPVDDRIRVPFERYAA